MTEINIKGDIVDDDTGKIYQYFEMNYFSPNLVSKALNDDDTDDNEPIDLNIASGGGDVFAASEIYTMLKQQKRPVNVVIQGMAASAASVIAMAGDKVSMSPTSQIMIHKAWSQVQGNSDDLTHESTVLSSIDKSIAAAYEAKTGKKEEDILNLMSAETWLNAKDAVEQGFADEILFTDNKQPQFQNAMRPILNKAAVNKLANLIAKAKQKEQPQEQEQEKPKNSLLKTKLAIYFGKKEESK